MHLLHAPYGMYEDTASELFELSVDAKRLRRYFEDHFLQKGYGPGLQEICADLAWSQEQSWQALHELERGVQVMFVPGTENLVKMPPFSYVPTRHRVRVEGRGEWFAGCAGEACAINGLFPGQEVVVTSMCPDCWQPIVFKAKDRQFVAVEPDTAVIHIGIHPADFRRNWIRTCDSINFFISGDHVKTWEEAFPEMRGITMPVSLGPKWVEGIAVNRYWNYDRGPDVAAGSDMVGRFREMGVDVTPWE